MCVYVRTVVFCLQVQDRFDVDIKPLPDKLDSSTYMNNA